MLYLTNMQHCKPQDMDKSYAVVRSYKTPIPGVTQKIELSPSYSLFHYSLKLKNEGKWSKKAFEEKYVPLFLSEMVYSKKAIRKLRALAVRSHTEDIELVGITSNQNVCHRIILGGIIKGMGGNVAPISALDDNKYYDQFCEEYEKQTGLKFDATTNLTSN